MDGAAAPLEQVLARLAQEGELYERLPEGRVRCVACGHRCLILPGQRGVCKVRWNEDGRLLVPAGYVAGLQLDPVEKKPFFHAYPGSRALSFGMLGCDYHCGYCTVARTRIVTTNGPVPIKDLFESALPVTEAEETAIRWRPGLQVYGHTGRARTVGALFRHAYSGPMVELKPAYLLPIRLTPDHEVLALTEADRGKGVEPRFIRASELRPGNYLAIPNQFDFSEPTVFEVPDILHGRLRRLRHKRKIGAAFLRRVLSLSAGGMSSRQIGLRLGKSASHIRHLRSKVGTGVWDLKSLWSRQARILCEDGRVRLSKEHAPGIPERVPLDERLAALLGYYAAEGCVLHSRTRVHAAELIFALGHHEKELAGRIRRLLAEVFGVRAYLSRRETILAVVVGKASLALFFEKLCGTGSRQKRIPPEIFCAPRRAVEAFLDAYIEGDGHRNDAGWCTAASVSKELAIGLTWLLLKTGRFPSIRAKRQAREGIVLGRSVRRAPAVYHLSWVEDCVRRRRLRHDDRYFYVHLERARSYRYHGFVYNLEVEDDHSYLAQFVATHNCQNAITSQALRDPLMGVPPQRITPAEIAEAALHHRARILTSTYNEPLITSEWAVEVFREGRRRGLVGSYVSNGNATPEVLEYIRPWVGLYKVDLKGFDDRRYRKLGGVLATVLDTIRRLHAGGFWMEIVTLIVPGFNDSDAELRDIARFLVSVSPDVPWHVTAFHPDYKMTDRADTTVATLLRAAEIGMQEGLRYVYAGNRPGRVGPFENTYCPSCRALLIERVGYRILQDRLTATSGRCPACAAPVPGRWR